MKKRTELIVKTAELAKMLGVVPKTVTQHKILLGQKSYGQFDVFISVPAWIKYQTELKEKKYDSTSELKKIQIEIEREKLEKIKMERLILQAKYLPAEDVQSLYSKLVHNTKIYLINLLNSLPNKLWRRKKSDIREILKDNFYKALDELSKIDNDEKINIDLDIKKGTKTNGKKTKKTTRSGSAGSGKSTGKVQGRSKQNVGRRNN